MRGIEAAFFGITGNPPDLKTAKSGKPWLSISVGVETGDVDDAGAAKLTWIRVAVFGDAAVKLAGAAKGTRLYCEGTLTQSQWNAADGEVRHGLNVAAFTCQRVGSSAIGRNRPPRERGQEYAAAGSNRESPAYCAGPRERPGIVGRDDFEQTGGDAIPF